MKKTNWQKNRNGDSNDYNIDKIEKIKKEKKSKTTFRCVLQKKEANVSNIIEA